MRKLALLLFLVTTLSILGQQTIVDHLKVTSYLSLDAAQAAATYTANVRTITPVRMTWIDANGVPYEFVTFLVISQPTVNDTPDDQIAVINTFAPIAWIGSASCGSGLRPTNTTTFADWPTANAWANDASHITTLQRQTLSMRELTGSQYPGVRIAVEYQIQQLFCTSH